VTIKLPTIQINIEKPVLRKLDGWFREGELFIRLYKLTIRIR
jgi:hypothetical protein